MIQKGSSINVIDNSGAKESICINIVGGYRKRYARIGDTVIVSIRKLRLKKRATLKIKKGEIFKGLVVRTKSFSNVNKKESVAFLENSIILLSLQNKLVGTRIFGGVLKSFRYTKYLKILSISSGIIN